MTCAWCCRCYWLSGASTFALRVYMVRFQSGQAPDTYSRIGPCFFSWTKLQALYFHYWVRRAWYVRSIIASCLTALYTFVTSGSPPSLAWPEHTEVGEFLRKKRHVSAGRADSYFIGRVGSYLIRRREQKNRNIPCPPQNTKHRTQGDCVLSACSPATPANNARDTHRSPTLEGVTRGRTASTFAPWG